MPRSPLLVVLAVATLGLAGCSQAPESSGLNLPEYRGTAPAGKDSAVAGRSAADVLAGARAAIAEADSVTVRGSTTSADGQAVSADLSFRGPDGSGTYSYGLGELRLIFVDGQAWYQGDAALYANLTAGTDIDPATVTRKIGDRWIVAGTRHPRLTPFDTYGSRDELLTDLLEGGGEHTLTPETDVDGQRVVGLEDESGTVFVATETLLPVRLVLAGDDGDGIALTYDEVTAPAAPPADQMLDLADLR